MRKSTVVAGSALVAAAAVAWFTFRSDANAIYKIVRTKCIAEHVAAPCVKLDKAGHYAVIRDRKGSHHYLVLPTEKIAGIESPVLLDNSTPNFFRAAWENRALLSEGPPITSERIMLAVNSRWGRSQDQLHIHLACSRHDVMEKLSKRFRQFTDMWTSIEGGLLRHKYWVRVVTQKQLDEIGPFRILAFGLAQTADGMGRFSVAMTVVNGEIVLLATERDLLDFNLASAEELQDQECQR